MLAAAQPRAIVVFDGECGLCNGFVAWLIRRDRRARFLIAGSAGQAGRAAVAVAGLSPEITRSTLLVWDGTAHLYSDAVLRVCAGLGWPWRAAAAARIVPRSWRDGVYAQVAKRRPRVEVEDPACGLPPAALLTQWRGRLATVADVEALRA